MYKIINKDHRMYPLQVYFGRWVNLARATNVSKAAVSQWLRDDGLPPRRALDIELLTDGEILAVDVLAPRYRS